MRIFFTDTNSNLTTEQADKMGVVLIKMPYIYKGTVYYDGDGVSVNEAEITTSALNPYEYQEIFAPYAGNELIYVSFSHKQSSTFENLKKAEIPNLTVIDSELIEIGQVKVLKRVMNGELYDDIRQFFITDNADKAARISVGGVGLFGVENGAAVLLQRYSTADEALAELKRLTNSALTYGKNLNNTLRRHLGKNYVGGVFEGRIM